MLSTLEPIFDTRKSFYGKAKIKTENGKKELYSYDTLICTIENGNVALTCYWNYSATTLRHLKDFLKQNNYPAETSKQIEKEYKIA